ncbi:MAG: glycosyltransferase [Clostridia bacterium]|nr:glycosyltransferase [Clostridia bacterium]
MNEEEKYFDYSMVPGKNLNKNQAINDKEPIISIITGYYNCKKYIKQTAYSIINQSFPYWEWIIVNDGSTEEGTKEILKEIASLDSRIKIYHEKNQGRIKTRDTAISKAKCDLLFILDADDVIERTMLECSYWTLQTNPKASWVYADLVNFDGQEFLWKKIFNSNIEKKENIIPVCSLIKKEALMDVGGYGVVDDDVHEDWHLWLRMLEKGHFPIRMNYYGFWYRKKKEGGILDSINQDKKRDEHAREEIAKQAKKIKDEIYAIQFPSTTKSNYDSYPYVFSWDRKPINMQGEKIRLLFIFPWFKVGGADKFNLDLIERLDKNKFDITIVTTEECEYIWRQKFEKQAEVFDLTSFLHRQDWPAFIHYIIKSRNIDIVMQSNSYFGFYAIPWLKSEFPKVVFTDYLHSANWSWRNGEYPRDSTAIDGFLDRTYTCTKVLRESMKKDMGRTIDNVKTVYIGVDEEEFDKDKIKISDNKDLEKEMDKLKGKKVLLFLCRISEEKRPIFMIKVLKKLLENQEDIVLMVVGDGPVLREMKDTAQKEGIYENIIFFGMQKNVKPFYKVADVSIICSLVEGLTITTYESLAIETPVVTADVGGQKELVDESCGRVVQNIQTAKDGIYNRDYSEEEINRYVKAIKEVLEDKTIKDNCRKKILNGYTVNNMVEIFEKEFEEFRKKGTQIDPKSIVNKDLYKQLIVMYNQLDIRNYFPQEGGNNSKTDSLKQYKMARLKGKLWQNPLWRGLIKVLKATGIMGLIKKTKLKEKIKKMI